MANMFSGKQNKYIPKNLDECIEADSMIKNLWIWSERLEKFGLVLFWLIIIFGVIEAITASVIVNEIKVGYNSFQDTTFDFVVFLAALVDVCFYAFLEYCAYHVLALLIGSLASIVHNTNITANITIFESFTKAGKISEVVQRSVASISKPTYPTRASVPAGNQIPTWKRVQMQKEAEGKNAPEDK